LKIVEEKQKRVQQMMLSGEVKDWEHYRNLTGQTEALAYMKSEIDTLLDKQGD
jgi:hypothetical protein|tara:strand:- start:1812 stop:1970 length:159 start_codon:yes stop_codon:yes gene_type:complete